MNSSVVTSICTNKIIVLHAANKHFYVFSLSLNPILNALSISCDACTNLTLKYSYKRGLKCVLHFTQRLNRYKLNGSEWRTYNQTAIAEYKIRSSRIVLNVLCQVGLFRICLMLDPKIAHTPTHGKLIKQNTTHKIVIDNKKDS